MYLFGYRSLTNKNMTDEPKLCVCLMVNFNTQLKTLLLLPLRALSTFSKQKPLWLKPVAMNNSQRAKLTCWTLSLSRSLPSVGRPTWWMNQCRSRNLEGLAEAWSWTNGSREASFAPSASCDWRGWVRAATLSVVSLISPNPAGSSSKILHAEDVRLCNSRTQRLARSDQVSLIQLNWLSAG